MRPSAMGGRFMKTLVRRGAGVALCVVALLVAAAKGQAPKDPGLLFYLSGGRGLTADVAAGGDPAPNFASGVQVIPGRREGPGPRSARTRSCCRTGRRATSTPSAARCRSSGARASRSGPTPFPIFRVGYARPLQLGHGLAAHRLQRPAGFDAFVTDASLARTRVSLRDARVPGARTSGCTSRCRGTRRAASAST